MKYKITTSFMTLAILSFLATGFTMAYFKDEIDYEPATFRTSKVKIEVSEGDNISQPSEFVEYRNIEWEIENKGTESIRLKTRVLEEGNDSSENIVLNSSNSWTQGDDGDYYYAEVIEPDTAVIFPLTVKFETWQTVQDYGVNIEAEAIQASNDAIDYEWLEHSYEK